MTPQAEILPMETGKIAVYSQFRAQLAEMKKSNSTLVFDYESKSGNKDARSHVYKLRQTKSAVEVARKKEKQESLEYGRKVDDEAKEIVAEIEEMIDVHQKSLDEIEEREKTRIADIRRAIQHIHDCGNGMMGGSPQPLILCLRDLEEKITIDDSFGEFQEEARKAKDSSLAKIKLAIEESKRRATEQAELERLRKQAAEREQHDRDEKIRRDAAERATKEAEEKARAEKEKTDRAAALEREAEIRMASEAKAASEKRELELKLAAATAEREKLEAQQREEKAKTEAKEREEQLKRDAERQAVEAVEQEKVRVKEEADKKAAEDAKREADKDYREKIQKEVVNAFLCQLPDHLHSETPDELPIAIMNIIDAGIIPHVKIIY